MITEIFDIANWQLMDPLEQMERNKEDNEDDSIINKPQIWKNKSGKLSPLTLYKFLKAKFGRPNGFVMFLKNPTSDNLIHWQYAFKILSTVIYISGTNSGLQIVVKGKFGKRFADEDWEVMIDNFNKQFKGKGKEMKKVHGELEPWILFINPVTRLDKTIKDYLVRIELLNLKEPLNILDESEEANKKYYKELDRWVGNMSLAASHGTTIRMLCPVLIEAFLNLILLVFRKEEYKEDARLYEGLLRENIDIKVKTLHLHCTCFPKKIDDGSQAFKDFHTLVNKRNDLLHGNIDPFKLQVEEVYFDYRTIPLFEKDEGVIKKMMRNYSTGVEREKAVADFATVSAFFELVLMAMDDDSLTLFIQILSDGMPGFNKNTKRLGCLFPSQHLAEFNAR